MGLVIIGIEALVLLGIMVALLHKRDALTLVPFYMFVTMAFVYADIMASVATIDFLGFTITAGSVAPFCLITIAFVWLYDVGGAKEAKRFYTSIVIIKFAMLAVIGLLLLKAAMILSPRSPFGADALSDIFVPNLRFTFFSLLAVVVELFLMLKLYAHFKRTMQNKYKFFQVFVTVLVALWADSLIFVGGSFAGDSAMGDILAAHLVAKTFLAFLFAVVYLFAGMVLPLKRDAARPALK